MYPCLELRKFPLRQIFFKPVLRDFIAAVRNIAQAGDEIFDLPSLIKLKTTENTVWDVISYERLFDCARLRIGPVKYRDFSIEISCAEFVGFPCDPFRLLVLAPRLEEADAFAVGIPCP